ncbi:MAG: hypothetical protein M1485_03015 [Chloroflexi bacterium]|nr:hypothetical protein [Chloroflexota bacterium]
MKPGFKFSFQVTLLLWLVLILTAWNTVRFAAGILWRDTLIAYAPQPGPIYIAATGALWALTGLFLLWSWWNRKPYMRAALLVASGLYTAWSWADRLFVQAELRANWPFDLLATVILLAFVSAVVLNPKNLNYFQRESYERKPENHPSA